MRAAAKTHGKQVAYYVQKAALATLAQMVQCKTAQAVVLIIKKTIDSKRRPSTTQ